MKRRPPIGCSGFTLLEILVAIFLFAILISAVFSSFRAIHDSAEALQREDLYYEAGQKAMARIQRDLESIYISQPPQYKPPSMNEPADPYRIKAETGELGEEKVTTLMFASLEHVALNGDMNEGVAQIIYYVQQSGPDSAVLRRADRLWPFIPFESLEKTDDDPVLCEHVRSLLFRFRDSAGEYHDTWDSDSAEHELATPRAMEITMKLGNATHSVMLKTVVDLLIYRKPSAAAR